MSSGTHALPYEAAPHTFEPRRCGKSAVSVLWL